MRPSSIPESTVGILLQEPPSTRRRRSRRTSRRAWAIKVKLGPFNEVAELMATDYSDELMEEMGNSRRISNDNADAWDIDSQLEAGDGRPALPARGLTRSPTCQVVNAAASRCANSC